MSDKLSSTTIERFDLIEVLKLVYIGTENNMFLLNLMILITFSDFFFQFVTRV